MLSFIRRLYHTDLHPNPMPYVSELWRRRFPHRMRNKWEVTHDEIEPVNLLSLSQRLKRDVSERMFVLPTSMPPPRTKPANLRRYAFNRVFAKSLNREVDLDAVEADRLGVKEEINRSLRHYNVLNDLAIKLNTSSSTTHISVRFSATCCVYYGNIVSASSLTEKPIDFTVSGGTAGFHSLLLVALDAVYAPRLLWASSRFYLSSRRSQYAIDQQQQQQPLPYIPPTPARGLGYHRIAFLLIKPALKTASRSTSLSQLLEENEAEAVAVCFAQTRWDPSVTQTYHQILGIPEPVFEYEFDPEPLPKQILHPSNLPFNRYLDAYRDQRDVNEQVLKEYLESEEKNVMYPHAEPYPDWAPSWYKRDNVDRGRFGHGKYAWLTK